MVQRKEPSKLTPKTKDKTSTNSQPCDHRHERPVSKETTSPNSYKKTMKIPNYMKPTNSSDARKDHSHGACNNSSSLTSSMKTFSPKVVSSPPSITSKKKPTKPFLKRNKSKVLFQQLYVNRATCSTTLKDSKFPKALDLNPGGTESDGKSVLRVCPYTYCSLNGHTHEPLPPLKSFLASKRKLIKAQQSMKLKGFSPFRKRELKKSEKEVSPLMQEVVNDFIVEIYTRKSDKTEEPVKIEEKEVTECQEVHEIIAKRDEEEAVFTGLEQSSDFSVEEMDAMVKLVEYVSCDHDFGGLKEKLCDLVVEVENEEKNPVGSDESTTKLEILKEFDHVEFMEDLGVFSDRGSFSSEASERVEESFEEKKEVEEIHDREQAKGLIDSKVDESLEIGIQNQIAIEGDKSNFVVDFEKGNSGIENEVEFCKEKEVEVEEMHESKQVKELLDSEVDENSETKNQDRIVKEGDESNFGVDCEEISNGIGREVDILTEKEERKEEISVFSTENEPSKSNITNPNDSLENENPTKIIETTSEMEFQVEKNEIDEVCEAFDKLSIEGEDLSFDPTCESQKTRLIFAKRRNIGDDSEYLKPFNPRAPNFLPLEAKPSGEVVDLRHQSIDERKNAEEWMIDYKIRRVVDELAVARKKKVQLLVAAFETVVPGVTCS